MTIESDSSAGVPPAVTGGALSGLSVGLFGHFDPDYARNRILAKALRRAGARVVELRDVRRFPSRGPALARRGYAVNPDVLLVAFPSHSDVPTAKLVALARRSPVIYDAFTSVWETNAVDRGVVRARSLSGCRYRLTDLLAFSLADTVLTDTNAHLEWFADEFNLPAHKFRRVWAGADDEVMRPCESEAPGDDFTVFFYGTYVPLQGIEHILGAAELLRSDMPGLKFVLCGSGQTYPEIRRRAAEKRLANVEFLPRRSPAELRLHMCESAICLGIFGTSPKAQRVIPNKAYDALACARPLITADSPAVRECLVHGDTAWLCPAGDPAALAEGIKTLEGDALLRNRLAANGHELFRRSFSIDAVASLLAAVVRQTLAAHG